MATIDVPSASGGASDPPKKKKGTHGGARPNSGPKRKHRPPDDTAKLKTLGKGKAVATPQPRATGIQSNTSTQTPAAFFRPVDSHRPIPRNDTNTTSSDPISFWAEGSTSHLHRPSNPTQFPGPRMFTLHNLFSPVADLHIE